MPVRLIFESANDDETRLECFANLDNQITILIEGAYIQGLSLDRNTAIKLSKVLKAEIAKLDV